MNNINNQLFKQDIESISKKLYNLFNFNWEANLSSPFVYSDTIRSIAKSVMDGKFFIKCLSEKQICCVSNNVILPKQLQLALSRKEKYSIVDSFMDFGDNSEFNIFNLLIIREGKILLANSDLGIFIKVYNEAYLHNTSQESKNLIDNYDLANTRLGIKSYIQDNLLFVLEPRVNGQDFSNLSLVKQEDLINNLAFQHRNKSCGNFLFLADTYSRFKNFASSSINELDPIHSHLFEAAIKRNFSNTVSVPYRLSHRDLAAHNLLVNNEIIPIDLSPFKLGYAPYWYDTLTLMITESSEYERHKLLINFIEGYNTGYTNYFPQFKNKIARIDAVVFNILFMTWLPFKINLKRITSWTSGYIDYLM